MPDIAAEISGAVQAAGASLDAEVLDYIADLANSLLEDSDGTADEVLPPPTHSLTSFQLTGRIPVQKGGRSRSDRSVHPRSSLPAVLPQGAPAD